MALSSTRLTGLKERPFTRQCRTRSISVRTSAPVAALPSMPPLEELLGKVYEHMLNGVCCSRIIYDGVEPVNRICVYANPAYRSQTGLGDATGRLASEVYRGREVDERELLARFARIATTGVPEAFEHYDRLTGQWYSMSAYSPTRDYVVNIFDNITRRKRLEDEREQYKQILERRIEEQVQDLRESEERYRGLFESLPVGVVVQASSGEVVDVNKAACAILRLSMEQFCGMNSLDAAWQPFHEDGSPFPGEEHPAMKVLATGEPQFDVVMGLGDEEDRTWISINSHPLFRKGAEKPYLALTSFVDITKRMRDDEAIRRLKDRYEDLLAAATEVAVITTDLHGTVTVFNSGAKRLLGYKENEVVGQLKLASFQAKSQSDSEGGEPCLMVGNQRKGLNAVLTLVRQDGSKVRTAVCMTPVHTANGKLTGHLALLRDMNDRANG